MHVRVRLCGKPEIIVVVPSKLTKIEAFRKLLDEKFGLEPSLQRLLYGGKLVSNINLLYLSKHYERTLCFLETCRHVFLG